MTTAHDVRFQSALGVLLLAASSLLAGCGSDSDTAADGQRRGADGSAAAAGSGGNGAANGGGGSAGNAQPGGTAGTGGTTDDADEYTEDAFGYVDPRAADFHPLDSRENALLRREELGIMAVSGAGTLQGVALDDASHGFAELGADPSPELGGFTLHDVKAANVDDDGNDELVSAGVDGGALVVRVVDSDENALFGAQLGFTRSDATYQRVWLDAADVDDDGRAELMVAAVTGGGVELRLYDDAEAEFAPLKTLASVGGAEEIAATIGNFDDDRRPEFAMLIDEGSGLELRVLDDAGSDFALLESRNDEALGLFDAPFVVRGLEIVAGDFDANLRDAGGERVGDAREELALFADGYFVDGADGNPGVRAAYLDDAGSDFAAMQAAQRDFGVPHPDGAYRLTTDWGWQVLTTDANGDGQDELFFLSREPGDADFDWAVTHQAFGSEVDSWTAATQFLNLGEVNGDSPAFMTAAAGRTDSRGRDVIVVVANDGVVTPHRLTADAMPSGDDYVYGLVDETLATHALSNTKSVFVAGGDWDADSLRVRFTGSKWLQLTRPQPIAIVAAPPAKDGISQNYDESSTAYGTAVSNGSATTEEYGVSNKITLSFESSFPGLDFLTAGAQAEMERQFTRSNTTTEMVRYGTSYAGAYPDDVIVFNGALCMRYEYQILGGGDPEHVGKTMTIDVPVDARIYKWTVDYYNQALGGEGSPIGADVLTHTVGDPASYPTATQRNALMAGHDAAWKSPKAVSVGQGTGSNSVTIDVSTENETTDTLTLHTEYGGSVGAFVGAGYSQGYDETSAYTVTVGSETNFAGSVGDIESASDYTDWFYSFGLFVYPTTLEGGESVQIIQYWTEGLSPKYDE